MGKKQGARLLAADVADEKKELQLHQRTMRPEKEDSRLAARGMMVEGKNTKHGLGSLRKLSFSKPFSDYLKVFIC